MSERPGTRKTVDEVLRRAEARLLACPYCQEPLRATQLQADTIQLACPVCGFTEEPDVLSRAAPPLERPAQAAAREA